MAIPEILGLNDHERISSSSSSSPAAAVTALCTAWVLILGCMINTNEAVVSVTVADRLFASDKSREN